MTQARPEVIDWVDLRMFRAITLLSFMIFLAATGAATPSDSTVSDSVLVSVDHAELADRADSLWLAWCREG